MGTHESIETRIDRVFGRNGPSDLAHEGPGKPLITEHTFLHNLPFNGRTRNKRKMVHTYRASFRLLEQRRAKLAHFIAAVSAVNSFPEPILLPDTPRKQLCIPDVYRLGAEGLAGALWNDLHTEATRLVNDLATALKMLLEEKQAGTVDFTCAEACKYVWYSYKTVTTAGPQERIRTTHGWTVTERTVIPHERVHKHVKHSGDMIAAEPLSIQDPTFERPRRIQKFFGAVPSFLQEALVVFVGDLTWEQILETDFRVEQWEKVIDERTFRYDPIVCLGGIVLTGWDDKEIKPEREQERREHKARLALEEERALTARKARFKAMAMRVRDVLACIVMLAFIIMAIIAFVRELRGSKNPNLAPPPQNGFHGVPGPVPQPPPPHRIHVIWK